MLCQSSREAGSSTANRQYAHNGLKSAFPWYCPCIQSPFLASRLGSGLSLSLLPSSLFVCTAPETVHGRQEPRLYKTKYTNQEAVKAATILAIITALKGWACHGGMGDSVSEFTQKDGAKQFQQSRDHSCCELGAERVGMSQMILSTSKLFPSGQSRVR